MEKAIDYIHKEWPTATVQAIRIVLYLDRNSPVKMSEIEKGVPVANNNAARRLMGNLRNIGLVMEHEDTKFEYDATVFKLTPKCKRLLKG
jgi:hypothetical protein